MNIDKELSNPETSAERLRQLSAAANPQVQLDIVCHPNCPEDLLYALLFNKNDALYHPLRTKASESPKTPPALLSRLSRDISVSVRRNVAKNLSTPLETLRDMIRGDWYITACVAQNPKAPGELLRLLSVHPYEKTREVVAQNPNTREKDLLAMLSKEKSKTLGDFIAQNPSLSPKALLALAKKNREHRESITKNPSTNPDALEHIFSQEPTEASLVGIARHKKTPAKLLEELAVHESELIRKNVAKNPNISIAQQELFSLDVSFEVRWAVAENPKLALHLLEALSNDKHWGVRWMIAQNPSAPASLLSRLLLDPAMEVRQSAEKNLQDNHPA